MSYSRDYNRKSDDHKNSTKEPRHSILKERKESSVQTSGETFISNQPQTAKVAKINRDTERLSDAQRKLSTNIPRASLTSRERILSQSLRKKSMDKSRNPPPYEQRFSSSDVPGEVTMEGITLYEEFRLIERPDSEINSAWKGAHLIVFFLAFVFGSFCTFCFHVLMYLFDEKCVLFPKMVSVHDLKKSNTLKSTLLNHIARDLESLPLDFVTTIWVDKSTCYLPIYVPLLSGICGLVWTSMFLMCSSGSQTFTGLNRPWRILPVVFCFSLVMSAICVYASIITHNGLEELCTKLGEVFGKPTCRYTINVATIAYERRIRGVYQAMRLTIISAWLHTLCWISSVGLSLARVILVVDFRLVRVRVDLIGNIEEMLERQEKLIRTDEFWDKDKKPSQQTSKGSLKVRFINKNFCHETEDNILKHALDGSMATENQLAEPFEDGHKSIFISSLIHNVVHRVLDSIETKQIPMEAAPSKMKLLPFTKEDDSLELISGSEAELYAASFRQKMIKSSPSDIHDPDAPSLSSDDDQPQQSSKDRKEKKGTRRDTELWITLNPEENRQSYVYEPADNKSEGNQNEADTGPSLYELEEILPQSIIDHYQMLHKQTTTNDNVNEKSRLQPVDKPSTASKKVAEEKETTTPSDSDTLTSSLTLTSSYETDKSNYTLQVRPGTSRDNDPRDDGGDTKRKLNKKMKQD